VGGTDVTDRNVNGLNFEDDDDRLPWLETADGYDYTDRTSPMKVVSILLVGLLVIAAIVGGIYWYQQRQANGPNGTGALIAAPAGPYKERPADAGGKSFEGEGDSAFAASEGQKTGAVLAQRPATAPPPAKAAATIAKNVAVPAKAVMVQLGAYGDTAKAETAWAALNKRFGFLAGVDRKIAEASIEGSRKVFRLQAIAANATDAQQLCAKLKAAGENCLIVR
jgi:hypothetical protein